MLMKTKLPTSVWGHAILHAATLIRLRPTSYHKVSPLQLVMGQEPNISHLRIFGSAVYVPVAPPNRTKMGSQRRLGIYVGFESPSIIRYLEPLSEDMFTARFADYRFDEIFYPKLGGETSEIKIYHCLILIHILLLANKKYKRLFICRKLQIKCQTHLQI